MRIINRTKNVTLVERAEVACTFLSRLRGLLGRRSLGRGEGLVISPCASIHTVGMLFPIDAVFYDKDRRVLAVVEDMRPFRVSRWHPAARGVIELPGGALSGARPETGDELVFSGGAHSENP